MTLMQLAGTYLISVVVFFAIDMLWLGVIARNFYQTQIGHLLGPVNWTAAIIFYLLFLVGLMIFVTVPALERQSFMYALLFGALFGFFTYATYDLTNFATLKEWPLKVVFVDIVWGAVLSGSVATLTYVAASRLLL